MSKDISQFIQVANRIPNDAVRRYCLIIIERVQEFELSSSESEPLWTYRTFSNWVDSELHDESLLQSISLLTSSLAPLLTKRYLWLSVDNEDSMCEVDEEFVRTALTSNVAEDPETGDLVKNPLDHIVPYFTPSPSKETARE